MSCPGHRELKRWPHCDTSFATKMTNKTKVQLGSVESGAWERIVKDGEMSGTTAAWSQRSGIAITHPRG